MACYNLVLFLNVLNKLILTPLQMSRSVHPVFLLLVLSASALDALKPGKLLLIGTSFWRISLLLSFVATSAQVIISKVVLVESTDAPCARLAL